MKYYYLQERYRDQFAEKNFQLKGLQFRCTLCTKSDFMEGLGVEMGSDLDDKKKIF